MTILIFKIFNISFLIILPTTLQASNTWAAPPPFNKFRFTALIRNISILSYIYNDIALLNIIEIYFKKCEVKMLKKHDIAINGLFVIIKCC